MYGIVNIYVPSETLTLSVALGTGHRDELIPDQSHKFDEVIVKHDWPIMIKLLITTKLKRISSTPGINLSALYTVTCGVGIFIIFFTDEESEAQKGQEICPVT